MIRNIIFDIDGTLADTSSDIIASTNYSLKQKGLSKSLNLKSFKAVANKGSVEMFKKLLGKNINKKLIVDLNYFFLSHYKKNICVKSKLKKNVLSFLKQCKKKKIRLFVSTNKSEKNAKLLLKKLKILKYFKFIAGSDTFNHKKPSALHLNMLHKKFFIKKDQTVLVGDTEVDSTLAKNFKIKFIIIKKGYTTLKPFDISSDVMISDFSQITQFLKKIS